MRKFLVSFLGVFLLEFQLRQEIEVSDEVVPDLGCVFERYLAVVVLLDDLLKFQDKLLAHARHISFDEW